MRKKNTVSVSVIIPVYNQELYIGRCLRSLLDQSLDREQYEIIIIEGDPHHFQFMKKTNQQKSTILVKLSLGIKPDTLSVLNRLKAYDNNAYHMKNITIKRGHRNYATASLFLFNN